MNLQWIEAVRREFVSLYGGKRGLSVCDAVIPGILGDFRKTVLAAEEGSAAEEEYRTEDRRAVLRLRGVRSDGRCLITELTVNGRPVSLGKDGLSL